MKTIAGLLITSLIIAGCGGGSGDGNGGGDGSNSAPQISGRPDAIVRAGENFSFTPQVSDSDGDQLSFRVENLPSWAFFDAGRGTVSGFPEKVHLGDYSDIIIKVFDGSVSSSFSFSLDVLPPLLGKANFNSLGTVIPSSDGYQSMGTLVLTVDGKEKHFEDSDLQLKFDAEGNLLELAGETLIPKQVSEHMSLDASVKTTVGYFSGKDLNADPDIDILLKDEQYYFVYYYGQDLDITLKDRDGSGSENAFTISTPLGAEILLITDPSDIFYYYYGEIPFIGAAGKGESDNGLIPFEPSLDYEQLDSFDGHIIEKASMGLGVKIFDFFNITGTRVIRQPNYVEILLDDPLFEDPANSLNKVEYKMGINGDADFAFAILGFGLFEFDLTEVSTTFDVGFDRQHMAMRSQTAPDVSWVPSTFAFVPKSETTGDWFLDGNGTYEIKLSSTFETKTPAARVSGSMALVNGDVTLAGSVDNGGKPLGVSATFFPGGVDVVVDVYADFDQGISQTVTNAMDDKIDEVNQAVASLETLVSQFDGLELSLNSFRAAVPAIVDFVVPRLNAIPGQVRDEVDTAIVNYVNNYKKCVNLGLGTVCSNPLDPLVNESKLGDDKGAIARTTAANAIKPVVDALNDMKAVALLADDEQFKAGIKAALQEVYSRRNFSKKITVNISLPLGIGSYKVYDKTHSYKVLDDPTASKILLAIDNVDDLEATSSLKLDAQQVFDALPLEDAINIAKQEVADGLTQIPTLDGVGYTVDNGVYSAYAILNGKAHNVEFNVLSPSELAAGIGRLIADNLL